MPRLIISEHTARLIREQTLPGFTFRETARPLDGSLLELEVDDEVCAAIEEARLSGESDDDVVGRLLRAATGRRPD
ncbi:MAG: hypothetical protein WD942_00300 [Dehalococcoidia bacterium]